MEVGGGSRLGCGLSPAEAAHPEAGHPGGDEEASERPWTPQMRRDWRRGSLSSPSAFPEVPSLRLDSPVCGGQHPG